ncbi:MAG TPA: tripartite tricarboxylate transporter substrate binding protein [Methyloceanibacter sp.]|nr:tripartite tricarboxylate transporter substrate binding protein [Methyloceanibacter sp.]
MISRRAFQAAVLLGFPIWPLGIGPATAETFPNKSVRIVVPFAAGTAPDLIARLLAEHLQPKWQQTIVVENRVGASGNVAAEYAARSPADGHTLLISPPPPLAINRFLFKSLSFKPSDLTIVTVLATAPNVLVAKPTVTASNVAELIKHAKSTKLSYASTGKGGTPHLTMEWLMSAANVQLVHVPYAKGLAPALNDLLGGHVDLMFANLSDAKAHVEAGKLKALAVTSADATGDLPGVEPISRLVPGLIAETWYALATPSQTPDPVVAKIATDVKSVLRSAAVAARLKAMSLTTVGSSPKDASAFVEDDAKRWHGVIEKIGLQPE